MSSTPTAAQFERERPRLLRIAYRMLGSVTEAEDVVQEAFVRWRRVEAPRHPGKLLATIVTRLCLDVLKSARVERERYVGQWLPELYVEDAGPDQTRELADDLTFGFMTMLERLTPEQRAVFVMRTAFELDYADIAEIVGTSAASCRQLMKRARDRVAGPARYPVDEVRSRALARRFAEACNSGDGELLRRLLTSDCRLLSDSGGHQPSARRPLVGPDRVARLLLGLRRKYGATLTLLELRAGASAVLDYAHSGYRGVAALDITEQALVAGIYLQWNPDKLRHLDR